MSLNTFIAVTKTLKGFYDWECALMDVVGSGEFIPQAEALADTCANLLLGEVDNETYDSYWNDIVLPTDVTEENIKDFYKEIFGE